MNRELTTTTAAAATDFWTKWAREGNDDDQSPLRASSPAAAASPATTPSTQSQLPVLRVREALQLPANKQWHNRFTVRSETSNRIYIIAQHRERKHWGCSCPGYRRYRKFKHLEAIGLPTDETPYEAILES